MSTHKRNKCYGDRFCKYCHCFQLVYESRMGFICVNLDGDVDPISLVTRLVHVLVVRRVMS